MIEIERIIELIEISTAQSADMALAQQFEQYVIKARIEELENIQTDQSVYFDNKLEQRILELKHMRED